MDVLVTFFDFVARSAVVTVCIIFSGVSVAKFAVDYAFKAKQSYMNSMIDKATQVGANIDLGIQ